MDIFDILLDILLKPPQPWYRAIFDGWGQVTIVLNIFTKTVPVLRYLYFIEMNITLFICHTLYLIILLVC